MALINFGSFETGDADECRSVTGTATFSTSIKRFGQYSYTCAPITSGTDNVRIGAIGSTGQPNAELDIPDAWCLFDFYVTTLPSSSEEQFFSLVDSAGNAKSHGRITSGGIIKIYDGQASPALAGSFTFACSTGQFYILRYRGSTSASNSAWSAELYDENGTHLETISGTMAQNNVNHGSLRLGKAVNRNSLAYTINFDNWCIRSDAFPDVMSGCTVRIPTGTGNSSSWSSGTAPSDYTTCDEIPNNTTDYIKKSAASDQKHLFTFESQSSKGIAGIIEALKLHTAIAESSNSTSSVRALLRSNTTEVEHTGLNATTTYSFHEILRETDPATSADWTLSNADSVQGGVRCSGSTANVRCTQVLLMTLYVPPSGTIATVAANATCAIDGSAAAGSITGTLAPSSGACSMSGAGSELFTGTTSPAAGQTVVSISTLETFTGSAALSCSNASSSSTGTETFAGTVSVTASNAQAAASGALAFVATAAIGAGNATASLTGSELFTGTVGAINGAATFAGSGTMTDGSSIGSIAATAANASMSGSGAETFSGTVSTSAGSISADFSAAEIFAAGISLAAGATASGITAVETFLGAIAPSASSSSLTASGFTGSDGSLAATSGNATISAAGALKFEGAIAPSAANYSSSIAASELFTGAASSSASDATAAIVAAETFAGVFSGSVEAAAMSATGGNHEAVPENIGAAALTVGSFSAAIEALQYSKPLVSIATRERGYVVHARERIDTVTATSREYIVESRERTFRTKTRSRIFSTRGEQ